MIFRLDEAQLEWQEHCHRFAEEVMRPAAPQYDRDHQLPWPVIEEARRRGLHGLEAVGHMARDPTGLSSVVYAEELHWGCAGIALAISASWLAATVIASSGTRDQVRRWLPECFGTGDDVRLAAFAVTESEAGSDVEAVRTTARRDDGGWILNGNKVMISNAGMADVVVVVAAVDPALGHWGQGTFVVRAGTPGLSFGPNMRKMGIRASRTGEVSLEDCRVPAENLLGGDDRLERKLALARQGRRRDRSEALATFELTRPLVGAGAIGVARAAYEWTLDHLLESRDGATTLREQWVQQLLADVATEIDAARLLVWRASWMARTGAPMTAGEGSMSKLKAGDVAMWATTSLMDVLGPHAAVAGHPLEKFFRDAKIFQLFEGTAQIQRIVVARLQESQRRRRLHDRRPEDVPARG
jgi:acyl-CoA dehydrogenase